MVCTLLYSEIYSAQPALIFSAHKLLSYHGDSPAKHYHELILDVTEAAPAALIEPVKVIVAELGKEQL